MAGVAWVVVAGRVVGWGARVDGGGSGWLGWHGWWWLGGWSWRVAELVVEGVIVGGWRWVAGAKALARGPPRVCGDWVRGLWGLFRKLVNHGNPAQWYAAIPKQ